jgi:hypothetical protein
MRARLGIEGRRALARFRNVGPASLAGTLWRAATIRSRAAAAARPERPERLVVSLTTTPRRARNLAGVLSSLLDQTEPPDRLILALPRESRSGERYPPARDLKLPAGVDIVPCRDEGPATKLLPALELEPGALVVAVDDDVIYPRSLLATLLREHRLRPQAAIGFRGVRLTPGVAFDELDHVFATGVRAATQVDVLFGTWGYLVPPGALGPEVWRLDAAPEALRWVDDIWFSGHMARRGVERWVARAGELPIETPNVLRSALTASVNADGRNDHAGLRYFAGDW